MAMLAEPRQKKRRYNLTPRGKALYEDESRFGTKMLEKMGWSKGQGLGAKLNGSKDFVRVRMRNTFEGLGFEDRDDHWTQHEQDFSGLLKTLNGDNDDKNHDVGKENGSNSDHAPKVGFGYATVPKPPKVVKLKDKISGVSLEEKSKISKARVHYRKFTKGKDIAQYSEKDLANIFGKKVVETEQANGVYEALTAITCSQAEEVDDINPADGEEEEEVKSNFAGVQTVSTGLSLNDYFKQKMEAMKNKRKQLNNENVEEVNEQIVENVTNVETKKKIKKRKRQEATDENGTEGAIGENTEMEVQKKKDKSGRINVDAEVTEFSTQAKATTQTVTEPKNEKKNKKRNALAPMDLKEIEATAAKTEAESKNEKKNKKRIALESRNLKEVRNVEELKMKTKKSKKEKDQELGVISPHEVQGNLVLEVDRKIPKKSKLNKDHLLKGFEDTAQDEDIKEQKRKKECKKKGDFETFHTNGMSSSGKIKDNMDVQKPLKSTKKAEVRGEEIYEKTPTRNESFIPGQQEYLKEPKKQSKHRNKEGDENFNTSHAVAASHFEEMLMDQQPVKAKKSKRTKEVALPGKYEEPVLDNEVSTDQTLKTSRKKDKKESTSDEAITLNQTAVDACLDEVVVKKKKKFNKAKKLQTTPETEVNPQQTEVRLTAFGQENIETTIDAAENTEKQTNSKKDVSEDTPNIQTMTLDELTAEYNSYNVYTISSFCAEKFRNVDLESFKGATLSHLPGYGYSHDGTNLQMNIQFFPKDEQRIIHLWNCTINKYQLANPKAIFNKYRRNMVIAYHAKQKSLPRLHMKTFKRKSIFQSI